MRRLHAGDRGRDTFLAMPPLANIHDHEGLILYSTAVREVSRVSFPGGHVWMKALRETSAVAAAHFLLLVKSAAVD